MANEEHLSILKQGIEAWNAWRRTYPSVAPDLNGADLEGADLSKANLSRTNLEGANLRQVTLNGADLNGANLRRTNLFRADLNEANLRQTDLQRADLSRTNFFQADLSEADLFRADLSEADLRAAIFNFADLNGADLRAANLGGATFQEARLDAMNLERADVSEADLTGAEIGWTTFGANDLSTVKGLLSVHHRGPSTIGIDTLYQSGGKIPEVFLRGCGVPDTFIDYLPALVGAEQAIQFYSCFISYSSKDEEFAKRLHSRMRDAHLRVWFAPEDIKGGEKLHEQIEHAIQLHDRLLVVLSEHSMQSEWVMTEIRNARRVELREKRRKLFPIRLVDMGTIRAWSCFDADSGKDLAVEVREYFIPDFSGWKDHDAFESAFDRLLKDLRAAERMG